MTLDISREAFVEHAEADRPVVVRAAAELDVDVEPLSAYAALSGRTSDVTESDYTFLLESAEKVASSDPDGAFAPETDDRHARFSFVGYDPRAVVTVTGSESEVEVFDDRYADLVTTDGGDVVDDLRAAMPDVELRGFPEMDRQHLEGGLVGFLSYDAVYDLWLDEVGMERPDSRFPDAQFVLTTSTLRFDHAQEAVELVFTPVVRADEDAGARYDELLTIELGRQLLGLLLGLEVARLELRLLCLERGEVHVVGAQGFLLRQKKIAGVAILDGDHFAHLAQLGHAFQ